MRFLWDSLAKQKLRIGATVASIAVISWLLYIWQAFINLIWMNAAAIALNLGHRSWCDSIAVLAMLVCLAYLCRKIWKITGKISDLLSNVEPPPLS